MRCGRALRVSGWEVLVGLEGGEVLCQLRGGLKAGRREASSPVVAGDLVTVRRTDPGRGVIESVLPRTSNLSRVATGGRPTRQVIASNLDRFIVVVAARDPAPSTGFVDRALVMAESGGIEGIVICVNKTDLDDGDGRRSLVELYRGLSYPGPRGQRAHGRRDGVPRRPPPRRDCPSWSAPPGRASRPF